MATKDTGNTDREWDVELMCKLSGMLRDDEFRTLKDVISMAIDAPPKEMDKCDCFITFWTTLKRLGKIRVGEYGILVKYLELLHRQDCALVIRDYTTKIERQMCQPGPSRQTYKRKVKEMVKEIARYVYSEFDKKQLLNLAQTSQASTCVVSAPTPAKITKLDKLPTLPFNGAMGSSPLPSNPALTSPASTHVARAPASEDINKLDISGDTALMKAARRGDISHVRTLLQQGADPDISTKDGHTVLMFASTTGHKEMCTVLLVNNADVNLQTKFGETALINASRNGHTEAVAVLLENNADVNTQNKLGGTALMNASYHGHKETVAVLLENNADANLPKSGETALSFAKEIGRDDIAKMLMAAGAKQ